MTISRRSSNAAIVTVAAVLGAASLAGAQQLDTPAAASSVGVHLPRGIEVGDPVRVVAPSRPAVLPPLYVSVAMLQAFDASSTLRGLRHGAVEGNALVSGIASRPATWLVVKSAATASTILVTERLWKRNRGAAILLMAAVNGGYAVLAVHNHRTMRR